MQIVFVTAWGRSVRFDRRGRRAGMTNRYYHPAAGERAGRVRSLFDAIAAKYDLTNDLQSLGLHRRWKRLMVNLAGLRPGERALDLCCGTGDISFRLAEQTSVCGLDFSQPMLAVARQRAALLKGEIPDFFCGDALKLPFKDATQDVVTISYGLRNLEDFEGGLKEMLRVLKPGGRLLIMDFGKPDFGPWRRAYYLYLRLAVPLFGLLMHGDAAAYAYILESLRHYPGQRGVAAACEKLGCTGTRVHNLLGGAMSINVAHKAAH